MREIKQAVILAAGKGERLHPLTGLRPKVMLPVANKPLLQYVVEALAANGITDIIVVVGYRREQVQDSLGGGEELGVRIRYIEQAHQLGTADALWSARDVVDDDFLVLPGDNLISAETIQPLLTADREAMLVKETGSPFHYGMVVEENGWAVEIVEKPGDPISRWVNTGNYRLSRDVLAYLPNQVDLPTALQQRINDEHMIQVKPTGGVWLDANYPSDLLDLNDWALRGIQPSDEGEHGEGVIVKGPVVIGRNTRLRGHCYVVGPVVIGSGSELGPYTCLFPGTVIGHNVSIGSFTEIRNSVIEDSVQIGPHSLVHRSFIAQGCAFAGGTVARGARTSNLGSDADIEESANVDASAGVVVGEYVDAGYGTTFAPGVLVGKGVRIADFSHIRENVPEDAVVL